MSFGIQIGNQAGRSFLGGNGTCLLYWGYVDVAHTHTSTWTDTNKPLFNLPNTIGVAAFAFCNDDRGRLDVLIRRGEAGKWEAHISGRSSSGSVRLYVFVEPSAVPLPEYGIAAYRGNKVTFHSGRPLMVMREVNNYGGGYKPAITPVRYATTYRRHDQSGQGFTKTYLYSAYRHSDGNYRAGPHNFETTSRTVGGYVFSLGAHGYAVIDASHYELYNNLGNYPLS